MSARKMLDQQPGSTPDIRTEGDTLTFRFEVAGVPERLKLLLRCDPNGGVWCAIVSTPD